MTRIKKKKKKKKKNEKDKKDEALDAVWNAPVKSSNNGTYLSIKNK